MSKDKRRPNVSTLSELDYAKMVVAGKLLRKSVGAVVQTACYTYLSRNWPNHEERLIIEARQRGISPEDLFNGLVSGEIDLDK